LLQTRRYLPEAIRGHGWHCICNPKKWKMSITIDLSGQVALITGGTRGIGHAIVDEMVRAGARVAFCGREAAQCAAVERELGQRTSLPDRVLGVAADLRKRQSLLALVDAVESRWGPLDTLICNAADFGTASTVADVNSDRYMEVLEANVVRNFFLCQHVLPGMARRRSGSVILMGSIVGFTTMPTNIPYSSSKAAIVNMARSLAAEYAETGVRVNCISVGLIKTDSSKSIWEDEDLARSYIAQRVPMQRIGQPREIATVCAFLCSPLASYVTAAVIPVDGGRMGVGQSAGTTEQVDEAKSE
jgi:hypothetical protein